MPMNPYSAPNSEVDSVRAWAGDSTARRASFVLAAVGFALFASAVFLNAFYGDYGRKENLAEGVATLLAVVLHLVGIGIVFAVPRGGRLAPALINGISLGLIVGMFVIAATVHVH